MRVPLPGCRRLRRIRPSPFARAGLRARSSGASLVEIIILIGVVALLALAGFRGFGTKVYSKIRTFGDNVATLTPTQGGSSYCFAAGTLVATPDGLRAVETIRTGDIVWSRDEHHDLTIRGRVGQTFVTPDAPLVSIRIREAPESIRATPGHRFFTRDRGWVAAQSLAPDETLLDPSGNALHVVAVDALTERATVYNFEVEETHTYFVGSAQAWVHNPTSGSPVDCNGAPIVAGNDPPASSAIGPGDHGWQNPDNPFASSSDTPPPSPIGTGEPGWNDPNNPFLSPPGSPGSSPPGSPTLSNNGDPGNPPPFDLGGGPDVHDPLSGHQPPNVASVDPAAIQAALDNAFYTANYDWNQRTELTNHFADYAGKPAFVAYRYYGNLTPAVAQGIIDHGSVSGDGRTNGVTADQAVHDFDGRYDTPNALANAVNDHKNSGHGHSHVVSTSTNPAYVYPAFNNQMGGYYHGKVGLVIVTTQTGEKIYESAALAPHTNNGQMQGTDEHGHDYEGEHVYGGAILPGSIIYGATVPMGAGSHPPPRPWKK